MTWFEFKHNVEEELTSKGYIADLLDINYIDVSFLSNLIITVDEDGGLQIGD